MNKKYIGIALGVVVIVGAGWWWYMSDSGHDPLFFGNGERLENNNNVSSATKKDIIKAKLAQYDVMVSKDAKAIRALSLKYAEIQKENELKDPVFKDNAENFYTHLVDAIKSQSDQALVTTSYQFYVTKYGSRDAFEKLLKDPKTTYAQDLPGHITISLPQKERMEQGVQNIDMSVLDAYLVDGTWY